MGDLLSKANIYPFLGFEYHDKGELTSSGGHPGKRTEGCMYADLRRRNW